MSVSHFAYTLTLDKSRFSYLFASEVVWKLVTGHMEDLFPCVDGSQYHLQGVDELISVEEDFLVVISISSPQIMPPF